MAAKAKEAILARFGDHPEDEPREEAFKRNRKWSKPGPYVTKLSPEDEKDFQQWAASHPDLVADELNTPTPDYDVRGRWLAEKQGDPEAKLVRSEFDGTLHASDKWKTPYDAVFSRESIYATPDAPHWDGDKLMSKDGELIADETPKKPNGQPPPSNNTEKKSADDLVPMYAPDGTARLAPANEVHALLMRGAKVGMLMMPPGGTEPRVVPFEHAEAALQSGGTLLQNNGEPYPPGEAPVVVGHNAAGEPIWGSNDGKAAAEGEENAGGFVQSFGNALKGAVEGFGKMLDPRMSEEEKQRHLDSLYDNIMYPFERLVTPSVDAAQRAIEEARQGHYSEAAGHALAAAVPMVGPWAAQVAETAGKQLGAGNYRGAAGTVAGNAAAGELLEKAPQAVRAGTELVKTLPDRIAEFQAPAEELNQAAKPGEMSPKERWEAANRMGVNLDRAQATGATIPKAAKGLTEHSLLGRGAFDKNNAANIDALHAHAQNLREAAGPAMGREQFGEAAQKALRAHRGKLVDEPGQRAEARDLLNRIDKHAMDGQEFGSAAQQALRTHHDAMYDKASNMLTGALERQGARVRTGNVENIADQIFNENKDHFAKFPEALRTPGVKLAWDWVNRLKSPEEKGGGLGAEKAPARSLAPKEVAQLRSELWNLYQTGDLVGTPAEGWLKQLTGALDESMTDPANEKGMTPGEIQKFRAGTSLWKRMKSMYDDPQSPFFSILRSPEPKTVAGTLERLKPTAAQQFREAMGDIDRKDLVRQQQRQIVGHILDPNENGATDLAGLASRYEKLPKEQMRELVDNQHLNALGSLAKRTQVETPYDQFPRLKQIVEAPDGMTASRAMFTDSGALRLNPAEVREMGAAEPNLIPALRRQTVERLMDPAGNGVADLKNFPSRWNRAQSEPAAGVLTPEQMKNLDDLAEVSRTVHADANPSGTAKVLQPVGELSGMVSAMTTGAMTGHPAAVVIPPLLAGAERLGASRLTNPEATASVMEHEQPPTLKQIWKNASRERVANPAAPEVELSNSSRGPVSTLVHALPQGPDIPVSQGPIHRTAELESGIPGASHDARAAAGAVALSGAAAGNQSNDREGVSTPPNGGQITDTGTAEPNEVHDQAQAAAEMQRLEQQDKTRQASTAAPQPAATGTSTGPSRTGAAPASHGGTQPADVVTGTTREGQSPQAKVEPPPGATHEVLGENGETLGHVVDGEYVPLEAATA